MLYWAHDTLEIEKEMVPTNSPMFIITARRRSLGQSNIFRSVWRGGACVTEGGMCDGGACVVGGMHDRGHVW